MNIICIGFMVVIAIGLIYKILSALYHKTLRYETSSKIAKVTKKEAADEYTATMAGKTVAPVKYGKKFIVYLSCDNEEFSLNDEELYNSVTIGEAVNIIVHRGYNKRSVVKHTFITLA